MTSRTTLILPDEFMRELKRRAADRGETLSSVVGETLRFGLRRAAVGVNVVPPCRSCSCTHGTDTHTAPAP